MGSSYDILFRIGKYFLAREETLCDVRYFIGRNNKDQSYSCLIDTVRRKQPEASDE